MIEVIKYNLPDIDILYNYRDDIKCRFWIPDKIYVVLGVSSKPEEALIQKNISENKIPVYKRPSGGETVVLSPNTLVISAIALYENLKSPKEFFRLFNNKIIYGLNSLGIENLFYKGISDIAIKDKKILGSAIYRTKDKIFYQAVLNVSENPWLFEKYLQHPKKEPDYRNGRLHSDFVTSLHAEGYIVDTVSVIGALKPLFQSGIK